MRRVKNEIFDESVYFGKPWYQPSFLRREVFYIKGVGWTTAAHYQILMSSEQFSRWGLALKRKGFQLIPKRRIRKLREFFPSDKPDFKPIFLYSSDYETFQILKG